MRPLTFITFLLLTLTAPGCGENLDSLPPKQRAEKLKAFVKPGMDWKHVVEKFTPDRYSVAVADPKDPNKHIGGSGGRRYDKVKLQEWLDSPHLGFSLIYYWNEKEFIHSDLSFDRHGKFEKITHYGDFNKIETE